jgi:hypothetical protein
MKAAIQSRTKSPVEATHFTAARTPLLDRQCACGGKAGSAGGECAECRRKKLLGDRTSSLQPKLTINQPGDRFEREADRIAEQVMRMPDPAAIRGGRLAPQSQPLGPHGHLTRIPMVQRQIDRTGSATLSARGIQTKLETGWQAGGHALSQSLRDFFEPRFGHDFRQVRVHTDARASEAATAINARAFTMANHILFRSEEYAPDTPMGRRLLAHELAHVVQQRGGPSVPEVQLQPIEKEPAALPLTGLREFSVPGDGETAGSQADAKQSRPSGTIARYNVNKNGKILGWNMDHIAREVYQALKSTNAYIQINGYYPYGETEFDPTVPINVAKRAIVAWLGVSKIPDLDQRIVTYYGRGGPFPKNIGGEIDIRVAYSSLGPGARALGPSPESIPSERSTREPEEADEKPDHKGELETKLKLVPLEVSIPYEGGKKKYKQKLTLEIAYELPPIKQLSSRNVEISLGQFELGGQTGVAGGRKAGEKPKTVPVAELGVSVTIIGVKVRESLAGIPSGMKFELGLGVTGDIVGGELEVTGEFSIKSKSGFVKLEFDRSSAQFAVGFHFDVAKLFKPR